MDKKGTIQACLQLIRPHQFTKNLFVFLPAFFAFRITSAEIIFQTTIAFVAFSMVAGAVYIFNDWIDRHEDALHPEKNSVRLPPDASQPGSPSPSCSCFSSPAGCSRFRSPSQFYC